LAILYLSPRVAELWTLDQKRMTKPHSISIAAIGAGVCVISAVWLSMIINYEIGGGRGEYQSVIPFLIAFAVAVPIAIWPVRKVPPGWKRMTARSFVFTLFLAPLPFGPEGTLMPLIVTLIFPPLIFLFLFPGRIALSFLTCFGFFSVLAGIQAVLFPSQDGIERSTT